MGKLPGNKKYGENNMNSTLETVSTILNNLSPEIEFDASADVERTLTDLGVDSLDNMSLFLEIQEKFNLDEIPDNVIDQLLTPAQIVSYVDQAQSKAA